MRITIRRQDISRPAALGNKMSLSIRHSLRTRLL